MADALLYEKHNHIARITLNRPEKRNAIDPEMMVRLGEAWIDFEKDDDMRVAIVTGAGDTSFCAGADLARLIPLMTGARQPEDEWDNRLRNEPEVTRAALLRNFPLYKPVIAAINGYCLAAGTELVQGTDIRIASDNATIGLTEVKRGIVPAGGGIARMPRQIAFAKAMEILLVGDAIPAEEARLIGFVNYVVPQSELMAKADEFAVKIAENGPLAVRKLKEAVIKGLGLPIQDAYKIESEAVAQVMSSEDAREGPLAFMEGRKPKFTGK
ncbi:MAG: enoyl-CoA hydratase/isomerase family protein [Chloroflexi bacterium]|nr:enoyl-CoA hydratase/isomerase family protein [Chloroflexota bacterium]